MSNFPESQDFEFSSLQSNTVELPPESVDWALQVSQSVENPSEQWQVYLRALALKGFQQWVEDGALDLAVYYPSDQPPGTQINCRVGDFRLCLIAQGSLSDEFVTIPCTTLENSQDFAHLYVLAEVEEEVERVTILSGLRRDRILAYQQTTPLELNPDNTYSVPVRYFDTAPEDLLLYLTLLNPQRLTDNIAPEPSPLSGAAPWREIIPNWGSEVINVASWLNDQLGEVANRLAWTLLPPIGSMEPALEFRRGGGDITAILRELSSEVTIPPTARIGYTDYQEPGLHFRLYVSTWALAESDQPEWSLVLILAPGGENQLPPGVRLTIRDRDATLVDQTLAPDADSTFLYGQVIGALDEPFFATVELPDGSPWTCPPFVFQADIQEGA